jgi:hypothetical protein
MSKRKYSDGRSGNPMSLDLDLDLNEEQIAALHFLPDALHPNLKCLVPVLDSIRKAYTDVIPPRRRALPVNTTILHDQKRILTFSQTRQATDFKGTTAAAQALAIDCKEDDISYYFNLKTEYLQYSEQLSEHFGKCACTVFRMF